MGAMRIRTVMLIAFAAAVVMGSTVFRRAASGSFEAQTAPRPATAGSRTPVLVELFTSEGCSSCPPADALVARLLKEQPVPGAEIIVLKEHVDYWNRLGWNDRFSSAQFTTRQNRYSDVFRNETVYTPQMVVDGAVEFVGSSERRAVAAISSAAQTPKPVMSVELLPSKSSGTVVARVHLPEGTRVGHKDGPELFLAITEGGITSRIGEGENAGRTIDHEAVARALITPGAPGKESSAATQDVTLSLDSGWNRANLRIEAFLQEKASGRVVAVTSLPL
jgi:hypothetical protein